MIWVGKPSISGPGILSIGAGLRGAGGGGCTPFDQIGGVVSAGATFTHPADGVLAWTITELASSGGSRILVRYQDSNNFWYVTAGAGADLNLTEVVSAVRTVRAFIPNGSRVNPGSRIVIVLNDDTITAYMDGFRVWSYTNASNFKTATQGKRNDGTDGGMGIFTEGGTVSDLKTWVTACAEQEAVPMFRLTDFSESGLATARGDLIANVWRTEGVLPSAGVDTTEVGVTDPLATSATGLASVDKLTTDVGDATARINYVWRPAAPNGKLVVYHYGHTSEDWNAGGKQVDFIHALIDAGYTVCGAQMPPGGVGGHNANYPQPTSTLNPIKYFVESVIRCMNELEADFDSIYMAGLSGGAWTTVLCAALETRIARSVHVDGTFPLFIAEPSRDYEQFLPGIRIHFEYTDLYVMASSDNRRQNQVHVVSSNLFDKSAYDTRPYGDEVVARIPGSGSYSLIWDSSTTAHEISATTRSTILAFFGAV